MTINLWKARIGYLENQVEDLKRDAKQNRKNRKKTILHLQKARRDKKNLQQSLELREVVNEDLRYQILALEEDARVFQTKIDQLHRDKATLETDLIIEKCLHDLNYRAVDKLEKTKDKHILHLQKARADKKSLYGQLIEVTEKADYMTDEIILLKERLNEAQKDAQTLYDENKVLKTKNEELNLEVQSISYKAEKATESLLESLDKSRDENRDNYARATVAERERDALKKDVLNMVRIVSATFEE